MVIFLPCETTKPLKSPCRILLVEPKWPSSFWYSYLTCLIWESYLINCTFQSHDPGILSLTFHEYFTANDRKGDGRRQRKSHSKALLLMKRKAGLFCNLEESFKNSDFLLQFRVTCQRDVHNPAPQDNLPVTRSAIERRQIVDTTSQILFVKWPPLFCSNK